MNPTPSPSEWTSRSPGPPPGRFATEPQRRTVKVAHLVFGVAFVGIAALWALGTRGDISAGDVPVLVPVVLICAGAVGLVAAAVSPLLRRRPPSPADWSEDTTEPLSAPETKEGSQHPRQEPRQDPSTNPEDPTKEIR